MESILDVYDKHITQNADPRIRDWPLMPSIVPSVLITALYLVFVLVMPRVMQNKPALNLQIPIVLYNFGMVLFSFYIFVEILMAGWLTDYSVFGCQPVDYSDSANGFRMARACWLFFISKYVELSDTVFFILRKKNSQVTFLHVFHHGALPIFWWFGVKIVPGGFGTFHTMVNAFVHTVMYFYYGVSALGPRYRKYLWWKRYITILQLVFLWASVQPLDQSSKGEEFYLILNQTFTAEQVDHVDDPGGLLDIGGYYRDLDTHPDIAIMFNVYVRTRDLPPSVVADYHRSVSIRNLLRG